MTKHVFVALLMMVVVVGSIQAQLLQPRRTLGGRRLQRPMDSAELLASATNESERAQIEQRIKNGELPEPLIPIEEALALAEKGDGKGYYQLAVRYAKGEGIKQDGVLAAKFLKKAYDAKYSKAIFVVALRIERSMGRYARDEVTSSSELIEGVVDNPLLIGSFGMDTSLLDPWADIPKGITNEAYIAKVSSDYAKAKALGIGAAEKELARFESRIVLARAQVKADLEKAAIQKKNDEAARKLIDAAEGKTRQNEQVVAKEAAEEAAERKREEEEHELWSSWPNKLSSEALDQIAERTEEKFNCSFIGVFGRTNTWQASSSRSLVMLNGSASARWMKLDPEGRIVRVSVNRDLEELGYFDAEREKFLESERVKWATEHGMTLDEAKVKYAKWEESNLRRSFLGGVRRPGQLNGGSLRARRLQRQQVEAAAAAEQAAKAAERQAQAEQEKQRREAERAEQRRQLLAIQEELKRVHEAKAAAEKEGR